MPARQEVVDTVTIAFPVRLEREAVLADLDRYGHATYHLERERVQLAILTLAEGDPVRISAYVDAALIDYRDVLYWLALRDGTTS